MPDPATYRFVEAVEGEFAQLMELFAAWRADIDSEPFAYDDAELLRAWQPPPAARREPRVPPRFGRCPRGRTPLV